MLFDIPLCIVIFFLLSTLVVFFYSIRRLTSFREYAVGNKQFSTATLVVHVLASYYGGGLLMSRMTQCATGLFWISWSLFGAVFSFLILSWLATHMSKFIYHISMAETIGRLYGKSSRVITALFGVVYSSVFIAMQISVMFEAVSICIPTMNPFFITILATGILIAYSIFGGIRVIAITDVWQCITFSSIIVILVWFMFKTTSKSPSEIISFLQTQKKFALSNVFPFDRKLVVTLRYLTTLVNCIEPAFIHSVYMSASPIQAKKVFLYASIFSFFIMICMLLVGLFVFVKMPLNLQDMELWNQIILNIPLWLRGMLCICLLALAMSTADSRLHICTIMISYDLLQGMRRIKKKPYAYQRWIVNITMLVVSLLATVLSLFADFPLLCTIVVWYTRWYVPIVVGPFILAILGFRVTSRTALVGMVTGALSVVTWEKWIEPIVATSSSNFPCMLVNGLAIIAAHYLLPRPKHIKEPDDDALEQIQ